MRESLKRQRQDPQVSGVEPVVRARSDPLHPVQAPSSIPPSSSTVSMHPIIPLSSSPLAPEFPELFVSSSSPPPRPFPKQASRGEPPAMTKDIPFIETMGVQTVKILANNKSQQRKVYSAHRNLIIAASSIMKEWLEDPEFQDELYFEQDALIDVQDFVNLLYCDRKRIIDRERTHEDYLRLYRFADKYKVDGLRDIAMDGLQDKLKAKGAFLSSISDMGKAFSCTSKGPQNKLYRFYTAMLAHTHLGVGLKDTARVVRSMRVFPDLLEDWLEFQHCEHEKQPALRLFGRDPRKRVEKADDTTGFPICYFHVHPPEQECPTKANHGAGGRG
ncbi:uncharacterized protein LY89DRAFT_717189 [Mollisia scopiformis]|uniref:BTB domain-containing protein n=1 Tax=Mollisia scopiformis TaxID=149040 RepID=A0A194XEN2_MOLSC|nr:uncharacterized protein LY89DRAFT_717189 [Mollisia scopiformis]KUJ18604.1 hypothetical protein LY89DRAFT_717189 [Mollisia scopiformis]